MKKIWAGIAPDTLQYVIFDFILHLESIIPHPPNLVKRFSSSPDFIFTYIAHITNIIPRDPTNINLDFPTRIVYPYEKENMKLAKEIAKKSFPEIEHESMYQRSERFEKIERCKEIIMAELNPIREALTKALKRLESTDSGTESSAAKSCRESIAVLSETE